MGSPRLAQQQAWEDRLKILEMTEAVSTLKYKKNSSPFRVCYHIWSLALFWSRRVTRKNTSKRK